MGTKPKDPAYWRKWRAAHPEYRQRQNRLRSERRKATGRGDRQAEYTRRPSRAIPDIPPLHQGHSLLDRARAIVERFRRPDQRATLVDPLYDDMIGEAVVALLVGYDPVMTIQKTLHDEWQWRLRLAPLHDPGDKDAGV